jgi:hypothetical protein
MDTICKIFLLDFLGSGVCLILKDLLSSSHASSELLTNAALPPTVHDVGHIASRVSWKLEALPLHLEMLRP